MPIHRHSRLDNDPRIWRASQHKTSHTDAITSGFPALDHLLAASGWPRGSLIECHCPWTGIGEFQLFLSAMRYCTQQQQNIVWVDPPHTPYAPALNQAGLALTQFFRIQTDDEADQVWTLEQLLQCPASGLIMGWRRHYRPAHLRRLQLAAETGNTLGIVVTTGERGRRASPAPLTMRLAPAEQGRLNVTLQRQRGGQAASSLLPLPGIIAPEDRTSRAEGH